jgi:DNA-binding beta-propeller fold protein YncE
MQEQEGEETPMTLGFTRFGRVAVLALAAAGLLALPSLAGAANHPFLPNHFPPPKEKKGIPVPNPLLPEHALTGYETPKGSFKDACGLAVDGDGSVYISDYYHDVVVKFGFIFEEAGKRFGYISPFPDADPDGGPCGLALGNNSLYVNYYRRGVWRYGVGFPVEIDPGPATGVAVDPASGRVYVTHVSYVAVYEPNGTPVMEGAEPMRIGVAELADAYGAAVSGYGPTLGDLYVADASDETVKVFDPATSLTTPIKTIDGAMGPQQGFRDLIDTALAIDPVNGSLFVADRLAEAEEPPMVIDEIAPNGNFRGQLQHFFGDGEPPGIALDPTNHNVYVTTGRGEHSGVYAFGPAGLTDSLKVAKTGAGDGKVTSSPNGISCPSGCAAGESEFDIGSLVVLNAAPAPHSAFSGWSVAGQPGACPGTGSCQVQMTAPSIEVTAEFSAIPQQTLSVATEGSGAGVVTSSPAGIECGATCSEHFDEGSTVTLTASPEARSHLAGWKVAGAPSACPGTGTCAVTMDQATQVTAVFAQNPDRTLSLTIGGPGRVLSSPAGIDCQASCAHAFADGTAVTLEAEPASGYELLGWTGACSGKRRCPVQMVQDAAVTATFVRIEDALGVSVIGSGTGTVSDSAAGIDCGLTCAGIYKRGSVLTLTARAERGSRFIGFAGCDSVAGATCTVTVTEAKTVTAIFGEAPEIAVRRVSVRGARAEVAVSVPSPGLLRVSGRGIVKEERRAHAEGVVNLRLSLSDEGRRLLREKGKLSIWVTLRFTSADGSTVVTKKIVTFRRGRGR